MANLLKHALGIVLLALCVNPVSAQTNINRVEYYLDADPGYGKATAAFITASPDLNTSFNVSVATLTPGLHIIGVRSQDAKGSWSFDERWLLLKQAPAAALANINKAEWYLDKDPGYGKATDLPLSAGTDITNLSLSTDIAALTPGLHIIGVRSRNANGTWSFDERWLLLKQAPAAALASINKAEWYLDKDPGYGQATDIPVGAGNDVDLNFSSNKLDTLKPGLHIIGVRSRYANGAWSFDERWLLLKQATTVSLPNLKRIEYYIDTDPGLGKGIPIAFLPAKEVVAPPVFVNVTGISAGTHKLFIRSQDDNNRWSFDDISFFTLATAKNAPYINVNSVAFTNVCAAGSFTMGYHATGTVFNPGNQFKVELSNAQGSFTAPQQIGSLTSTESGGIINCVMPGNITQGSGFKMRVSSTNPPITSDGSNQSLSISVSSTFLGNDTFKIVACAEDKVDITSLYDPANSVLTWSLTNPTFAPVGIHSVYAINSLGCKDTALITVTVPTATWKGTISTDWNVPGNWDISAVPVDTTHVIIPPGTTFACEIKSADATAASVQVKDGAKMVSIKTGRKLIIKAACSTKP